MYTLLGLVTFDLVIVYICESISFPLSLRIYNVGKVFVFVCINTLTVNRFLLSFINITIILCTYTLYYCVQTAEQVCLLSWVIELVVGSKCRGYSWIWPRALVRSLIIVQHVVQCQITW